MNNLRRYHRIISLIIAIPFAVVIISGLLLQVRQNFESIQPRAVATKPIDGKELLTFKEILSLTDFNEKEVDQIIYRPGKFNLSLRLKNGNEVQLHPQTGEVLKNSTRLTTLLIDLHQGSYFSTWVQYLIFLPAGLGVLFLLVSGLMIYPRRKKHG